MKKRAIILGSTGSVGHRALEVLGGLQDEWEVAGLAVGSRDRQLAEQANRFRPGSLAIARADSASDLEAALAYSPSVHRGPGALLELVDSVPCDCVVSAVVGLGGLAATLRAVSSIGGDAQGENSLLTNPLHLPQHDFITEIHRAQTAAARGRKS